MADKYEDLRAAAQRRRVFCDPNAISSYRAHSTPEIILSLLEERDALRAALQQMVDGDAEAIAEAEAAGVPFPEEMLAAYRAAVAALAQHQGGAT